METNELKELFKKFNNINSHTRDKQYYEVVPQIYETMNIDINKIKSTLEYSEEKIFLKSIYLIEFYDFKILRKPINNLLYFILNEESINENVKNDYINQAEILIKHLSPENKNEN